MEYSVAGFRDGLSCEAVIGSRKNRKLNIFDEKL